ncbi:ATP-binding protein [Streptacidiphilus anmyonensis]|uniref:ATP-binding protein n=1 Tax=Streptacidiphilus anmyonensis TaxID=405782 RepID=UPI0007C80CD0|nr:ATP-binding protein [Streptacidiphilus anmyonensis]
MQGRIKRGGGAGNPADRGAAGQQQPSPNAPHAAEGSRPGPAAGRPGPETAGPGATPGAGAGNAKGDQKDGPAGASRIGRVTPPKAARTRRFSLGNWRIRSRLTALLVLPVVAAIVLGGLRIQGSIQTQQQLDSVAKLGDVAQAATLLATALENERDDMALASGIQGQSVQSNSQVLYDMSQTAKRHQTLSNLIDSLDKTQLPGNGVDITSVQTKLQQLRQIEANAFAYPTADATAGPNLQKTVAEFDGLIAPLTQVTQDLALASSNLQLVQATRSLQAFTQWHEDMAIVRSTLLGALAYQQPGATGPTPVIQPSDRQYAAAALADANTSQQEFTALYGPSKAGNLIGAWQSNTNISEAQRWASKVLSANTPLSNETETAQDWYSQSHTQMLQMAQDESFLVQELNTTSANLRSQAQADAYANAGLIVAVLLVAILGAGLVARSMVRTLAKLQQTAEDVAEHTLPEMVRKLSESDPQDVDVTIQPIGIDTRDEIGHVARAFDKVHSQAVRLAAEQALLRGNINAMFTNLSRRSQGLIQRQLAMISELESREADPDQLAQLFKLDHLATRMRRNGENLLVLAGEDPGRRWTRPVPLVDVLRAAASEVEQYERIELASVPTAEVAGRVVNDLVHLLAELLENATSFSSPQTRVRVTGHALPDGRVLIEIHDTGIGLSPDDLAEINERLANPPVVDVSVSRRMGLFVVGRLSLRHGIRIQLRPSDSGGTTALVMLPVDVTNVSERRAGATGGTKAAPAGQQRPAAPSGPQRTPLASGPQGGLDGRGGRPTLPQQSQPNLGLPQGSSAGSAPAGSPQGGLPQRGAQPTDGRGLPTGPNAGQDNTFGGQPLPQRGAQPTDGRGLPTGPNAGQGFPQAGPTGQPGGFDSSRTDGRGMPLPGAGPLPQRGMPGQAPQQPGQQQPFGVPGAPGAAGGRGDAGFGQERGPEPSLWAEQPQHGSPAGGRNDGQGPGGHALGGQSHGGHPLGGQAPAGQGFGGQNAIGDSTAQFARPRFDEEPPARPVPPAPVPPQPQPASQQDFASDPLTRALPPASDSGAPSPIFEQMETTWFRAGRAERMRGVQVSGAEAGGPSVSGTEQFGGPSATGQFDTAQFGADQFGGRPADGGPARPVQGPSGSTGVTGLNADQTPWRSSANDETWRRAEQVREPSAGGVMPSGLPRRVPKANLVPGQAESQALPGPQVSRNPDEVRGRLTNLRRGIQQGRAAGSSGPGQGSGPYGSNSQER